MGGRKNAMLTTEDRRWLTGEKSYEGKHAKQQRYQRRRDIRDRVYNAMLDFSILFEELDEDQRLEIFGEVSPDGQRWTESDEELRDGVRDGLAFLLRAVDVATLLRGDAEDSVADWMIEDALRRAGQRDGILVEDVTTSVDATEVRVPELLDALEAGEDLSPAALYLLLDSGALDAEELSDTVREQLFGDQEEV